MAITATYLGIDQDMTSPNQLNTKDGIADHHFQLSGLQAKSISKRRLTDLRSPYTAENPANAQGNWTMAVQAGGAGVEDWWAAVWTGQPTGAQWHVKVFYTDGTTDECDALPPSQGTKPRLDITRNPAEINLYVNGTLVP